MATLAAMSGKVSPFQLECHGFYDRCNSQRYRLVQNPASPKLLRQPPAVWLIGVCGLFGYHFLLHSPAQCTGEAGLINSLGRCLLFWVPP